MLVRFDYLVRKFLVYFDMGRTIAITNLGEDNTFVGKHRVYRFLSRHPQIKGMTGKPLDKAKVQAANIEVIDRFY